MERSKVHKFKSAHNNIIIVIYCCCLPQTQPGQELNSNQLFALEIENRGKCRSLAVHKSTTFEYNLWLIPLPVHCHW